jgi:hypothetical protein
MNVFHHRGQQGRLVAQLVDLPSDQIGAGCGGRMRVTQGGKLLGQAGDVSADIGRCLA